MTTLKFAAGNCGTRLQQNASLKLLLGWDQLVASYDSGDHLHPSSAGYKAMAQAIDLALFE